MTRLQATQSLKPPKAGQRMAGQLPPSSTPVKSGVREGSVAKGTPRCYWKWSWTGLAFFSLGQFLIHRNFVKIRLFETKVNDDIFSACETYPFETIQFPVVSFAFFYCLLTVIIITSRLQTIGLDGLNKNTGYKATVVQSHD